MINDITTLVGHCIIGYRIGKAVPLSQSDGPSGELYRRLTQRFFQQRLSEAEHAHYARVRDLSREAVRLAREGELDASRLCFERAEHDLRGRNPPLEVMLLAQSWIDQGAAFLETRRQRWDKVKQRLCTAMEADRRLEEQYGYPLHMGRVHIVHLYLRVEAAMGKTERALEAANQIVHYCQGVANTLPYGTGWGRARIAAERIDLREAMQARIGSEVGTILCGVPIEEAQRLFSLAPAWRSFADHSSLAEIHQWGGVKEAYLQGNTNLFLERCDPFLRAGRRDTTLWYAVVYDLLQCCLEMRPYATRAFRQEVARDAASWGSLDVPIPPGPLRIKLLHHDRMDDSAARFVHRTAVRRFQAYTVGLPRTGTSSLCALFCRYRTANEFMEQTTLRQIIAHHRDDISDQAFRTYIVGRDREGGLEMDASSFNHFYIDILVQQFPQAQFLFTIRDCYGWVNSYLKLLLRWRQKFRATGSAMPTWMSDYGHMLFGDFSWQPFSSREQLQSHLPMLIDPLIRHWANANARVLNQLPEDRSHIIRTDHLSESLDNIAGFIRIRREALSNDHHTNRNPDESDLLEAIDRADFEQRVSHHADDILKRVFDRK